MTANGEFENIDIDLKAYVLHCIVFHDSGMSYETHLDQTISRLSNSPLSCSLWYL